MELTLTIFVVGQTTNNETVRPVHVLGGPLVQILLQPRMCGFFFLNSLCDPLQNMLFVAQLLKA